MPRITVLSERAEYIKDCEVSIAKGIMASLIHVVWCNSGVFSVAVSGMALTLFV